MVGREIAALLTAAVLWGSAQEVAGGTGREPAPELPSLAERVTAFMTAWRARDMSAMYGFYCGSYQQKTPKPEFLKLTRLIRLSILEFRVSDAVVAAEKATVTVWRKTDAVGMPVGQFDSESKQVWLRGADGTWCKEDEPLLLPFPG